MQTRLSGSLPVCGSLACADAILGENESSGESVERTEEPRERKKSMVTIHEGLQHRQLRRVGANPCSTPLSGVLTVRFRTPGRDQSSKHRTAPPGPSGLHAEKRDRLIRPGPSYCLLGMSERRKGGQ
ncbi:hypothetical protein BaRGS_00002310 [Batillaria attramentaria]|uniref:Uncharacterized protein n=1 Tax=Batillaria attramentaria TaxID=370345 RepID=A0ABD0M3D3_9CAEN